MNPTRSQNSDRDDLALLRLAALLDAEPFAALVAELRGVGVLGPAGRAGQHAAELTVRGALHAATEESICAAPAPSGSVGA